MPRTRTAPRYRVESVRDAKSVASLYLKQIALENTLGFGLPEVDDRYHCWRVPLKSNGHLVGEVVVDAATSLVVEDKTTAREVLESRILGRSGPAAATRSRPAATPRLSTIRNTIAVGDSEELLLETPAESVDLVFTSPPYFNARPEYADYLEYEEYLLKMKKILNQCHRVLNEGRFFVINVSPVLIRRSNRNEASRRIAVPFDFHQLFLETGFVFMDDIIWQKPEGAGWATGRGRRFAADRHPLQYKPVPVTEYVLVYRKATDKLIDWNIRKHPDPDAVRDSRIEDGYEVTNVWKIPPAHSSKHPAVFPRELAEKVITYYSFRNEVVLDPFGGIGTTAEAAHRNGRRFVHYEISPEYTETLREGVASWYTEPPDTIHWVNTEALDGMPLPLFG